jgi:hypothetical protein
VLVGFITNSKTKSNPTIIQPDNNQKMCFELLEKIVKTSDFNVFFKKTHKNKSFVIYIDEATKKEIRIQILLKSKTDPNVPVGWLELDLIKNQLRDITNDPDRPILIKFDINLLKKFKNECLKYCLD